ncbi:type II/IV secretion system protein [Patescibacteria group bacterium]|nr:type II/IV secretion system protein [Patescibacteria group bacterium]
MSRDLTPREQANLEDFARDLGQGSGGASASNQQGMSGNQELVSGLQKARRQQDRELNPLTPSVEDDKTAIQAGKNQPAPSDDDIDLNVYARGDVGKVVDELKAEKAEAELRAKAKKAGLPFVRLLGYPISPEVLGLIPESLAKRNGIIAYIKAGKKVRLGVTDPTNAETKRVLESLKRSTPFDFLISVIDQNSLRYALKLYDELPKAQRETESVSIGKAQETSFEKDIKSFLDLKAKIKDVPTTKIIDTLLSGAVSVGASDVHIEPLEKAVRIRYRLDGVLHTVADFPISIQNALLSRLKFLAKLKLDISQKPQDGRFTIHEQENGKDHEIDIRVATMPAQYGEAVAMRLLDRETLKISINTLGLTGNPLKQVLDAIKRPQGMILECGPTGSGKTTTLYSLLQRLNDPGKKIVTLEDPVEYRLAGVTQSQVDPEKGYDFADGFRSVLRLDPDILMIGEIRDQQTAEQSVQAALTGHIVLSTLHTNDAPTAIPRLIDLGVRPFLLANAVNVIIAQRLVRRICSHCAVETKPDPAALAEVKDHLAKIPKSAHETVPPESQWLFMKGQGCEHCNGTGFMGRVGIFEVLLITDKLEDLALKHAPAGQIKQAAVDAGMMTMEQDGLIKAVEGITTLGEVWRVARDI